MRIIVILRPTNKRGTKTTYTQFRKALTADGFILRGPEIFVRTTTGRKAAEKFLHRIESSHPTTGAIHVLTMTERQYSSIRNITGTTDPQERDIGANEVIML